MGKEKKYRSRYCEEVVREKINMKYIKNTVLPKLTDLTDLEIACEEIKQLSSDEERKEYIDKNYTKWTTIKEILWNLGNNKCWYSEVKIQRNQGHVEHFRPKKSIAGVNKCGYWWSAFDWHNYRFSHPTCNSRIRDYLSGKLCGKGTYFPLKDETKRANCKEEEVNEEPLLLDPTIASDTKLICFDTSSGKPIPRIPEKIDKWKNERTRFSIKYYHLDEGTWNVNRSDSIADLNVLCDRLESSDGNEYDNYINELYAKFLNDQAEFLSLSYQVVRERGLLEKVLYG